MAVRDAEELREVSRGIRATADGQEIDDLDEQTRFAATGFAHHSHEVAQAGQKAIVADPQQRAAWNLTDARRFDNNRARTPASESERSE